MNVLATSAAEANKLCILVRELVVSAYTYNLISNALSKKEKPQDCAEENKGLI